MLTFASVFKARAGAGDLGVAMSLVVDVLAEAKELTGSNQQRLRGVAGGRLKEALDHNVQGLSEGVSGGGDDVSALKGEQGPFVDEALHPGGGVDVQEGQGLKESWWSGTYHSGVFDQLNGLAGDRELSAKRADVFVVGAMIIEDSIGVVAPITGVSVDNGFPDVAAVEVMGRFAVGDQRAHSLVDVIGDDTGLIIIIEPFMVKGVPLYVYARAFNGRSKIHFIVNQV